MQLKYRQLIFNSLRASDRLYSLPWTSSTQNDLLFSLQHQSLQPYWTFLWYFYSYRIGQLISKCLWANLGPPAKPFPEYKIQRGKCVLKPIAYIWAHVTFGNQLTSYNVAGGKNIPSQTLSIKTISSINILHIEVPTTSVYLKLYTTFVPFFCYFLMSERNHAFSL